MSSRPTSTRRLAALASLAALAVVAAPTTAGAAAGDDVEVVNTETIQVYTDATGKVQSKRVYEQLTMTGTGAVDLVNPIETDGLRNLDEFGGFEVKDGQQVFETSVSGNEQLRTVSNYDGDLPLEVDVEYVLDGKTVDPEDVVGEDGKLQVLYTVRNVTAQPQEISFPDGSGGTVTKTVDVPIPLVGSLTTTAPANFTDVQSEAANMAGDGKGGTKLSYTMTLFPPIGSDTAEFGYTATITDGVVPQTDISALPVNPLNVPTFKNAATSYQGGADTGARLAEGAGTIDENLLKLRDGAAELLAGLLKLHAGSAELSRGLVDEAAPGAARLASGAGELRNGTEQLAAGTGELDAGAKELSSGAGRLDDGLTELDGGVGDLDAGADQLAAGQKALAGGLKKLHAGVAKLPADVKAQLQSNPDYLRLIGALQGMADAVDQQFLPGLQGIEGNLRGQFGNVDAIAQGLRDGSNKTAPAMLGLSALNGCAAPGSPPPAPTTSTPSTECELISAVYHGYIGTAAPEGKPLEGTGVRGAADKLTAITGGLRAGLFDNDDAAFKRLRAGLSSGVDPETCADAPKTCGLKEAALYLRNFGIPALVDGVTNNISAELLKNIGQPTPDCDPEATLRCAAAALAQGGNKLTSGVDDLVAGVAKLSEGGTLLADGAGQLAAGTGELDSGAEALNDGAGQIADGAGDLSDGLGTAADGSKQLADGTGQAADGAPKLVDGAQRLSDEGTKQLVKAGEDTTQEYGELYATIAAGAERADADGMAFGAPAGAQGLTAYSFVVQGEDGEGGRNLARGLSGLVLLGAGAGAFALRRRFI